MNPKIASILEKGDPQELRDTFAFNISEPTELIRKKFLYWSGYFLTDFFSSKDAPFHKEIDTRNIEVYKSGTSFLDIAFRGAAKTNRTKLFLAYAISNDLGHYRRYIKILSKEIDNADQIVTDIYNIFVRPRVKAVYPEIFQKTDTKREERMNSFTTATGIKITANSVGTDQRGDIQDESRPDLILFEDFETRLSLMSAQITHKIWENMEEAKNGLSKNGGIIYNANYISERGNVHKLVKKIENQIITPLEVEGKPTWPERYTLDDVAKIKKDAEDYEGEYQCRPSASKDVYFDRESVDKQIAKQPMEEIAGLKIFRKYDPSHRIGSGHDVGKGVGLDSSTSCFMDFDRYPVQVIATYKNNDIAPDTFAYEIKRQAKRFGENYVAVENNYGSTNDILKTIYPTNKIHKKQVSENKIVFKAPIEYGWNTNPATKPKMLADFSKAIEDGIVDLNDLGLIEECKSYTLNDFMDREIDPRLTTRHFDLLMAACICWQINKHIRKPDLRDEDETDPFMIALKKQQQQQVKPNPAR